MHDLPHERDIVLGWLCDASAMQRESRETMRWPQMRSCASALDAGPACTKYVDSGMRASVRHDGQER